MDGVISELLQGWGETVVRACYKDSTRGRHTIKLGKFNNRANNYTNEKESKNYRGISPQSIPGKATEQNETVRPMNVKSALGKEQASFRPGRNTIDQLFTMRHGSLKGIEHNQKVLINSIDFKQAFDSIRHNGMWRVMQNAEIPE